MKHWQRFLMFLFIAFLFALFGHFFSNPYPCTDSCIGCDSAWEMLSDTWVQMVSVVGILVSMGYALFSFVSYPPSSEEEKK